VDYVFVVQGPRNPLDCFIAAGVSYEVIYTDPWRALVNPEESYREDFTGRSSPGVVAKVVLLGAEHGVDPLVNLHCSAARVWGQGQGLSATHYNHFVLLSGGARGPFLPAFAASLGQSWLDIATQPLGTPSLVWRGYPALRGRKESLVRLVGSSVHCASSKPAGWGGGNASYLHLSPTFLAMDGVGLSLAAPHLLQCFASRSQALSQGTVATTQAILKGGGRILALQSLWGGHSLGERELGSPEVERRCAAASAAGGDTSLPGGYFQGGTLHPLEAMFVPCGLGGDDTPLDRWSSMVEQFSDAYL